MSGIASQSVMVAVRAGAGCSDDVSVPSNAPCTAHLQLCVVASVQDTFVADPGVIMMADGLQGCLKVNDVLELPHLRLQKKVRACNILSHTCHVRVPGLSQHNQLSTRRFARHSASTDSACVRHM